MLLPARLPFRFPHVANVVKYVTPLSQFARRARRVFRGFGLWPLSGTAGRAGRGHDAKDRRRGAQLERRGPHLKSSHRRHRRPAARCGVDNGARFGRAGAEVALHRGEGSQGQTTVSEQEKGLGGQPQPTVCGRSPLHPELRTADERSEVREAQLGANVRGPSSA